MNKKIYGYDSVEGKLVINEIEAENVKWIIQAAIAYLDHPPTELVEHEIALTQESGKSLAYEDAEKTVGHDAVFEYIADEVSIKNMIFERSSEPRTTEKLREILSTPVADFQETDEMQNISMKKYKALWQKRVKPILKSSVYTGKHL